VLNHGGRLYSGKVSYKGYGQYIEEGDCQMMGTVITERAQGWILGIFCMWGIVCSTIRTAHVLRR
jgi:hypothetical protein